jgi:hypothetical protein
MAMELNEKEVDEGRVAVGHAFLKLGDVAVNPLIAELKSQDGAVRKAAVLALGLLANTRAVEPLIAALKDTEKDVRELAAMSLKNIGEHAGGPEAEQALAAHRAWSRTNWTPANPQLSSGEPFSALEHVVVFANDDKRTSLESPAIRTVLEDAAGKHLDDIVERIPINVIDHFDVVTNMKQTRSVPESAWTGISSINPVIVQNLQRGLYRVCVRVQDNPRFGPMGAIFLFYRK